MDIKGNIKGIVFKFSIIFLSLCSLLWFSIFSYAILYYLYIPAIAHIKPVYLHYDTSCHKGRLCKHPFDNISLIEEGDHEFLRGGQGYAIELVLEMPESERNLNQGMFMVRLDMLEYNGNIIKSSHRPALLRYRSPIFKTIYTFFFIPGLLAGSVEEKQSLVVPLFEKYIEDSYHPAHFAFIEVQAQAAEVYSSTLRIHAQFTGLRYLMYYWPVLSAVVGVGCNFLFLLVTIVLIWLRETMKKPENNVQHESWQPQSTKKEFRKQARKRQFQKFPGITKDKTAEKKTDISSRTKQERAEIENLTSSQGITKDRASEKKIDILSRTKQEGAESENLMSSQVPYRVTQNEDHNVKIEDVDEGDDNFVDADSFDINLSTPNVASNLENIQSNITRKRINQILGKKEVS